MPMCHHLQFVQSLEPLSGGGLGAAALQLHNAMRAEALDSRLFATCSSTFKLESSATQQFPRSGPAKFFYAPGLAAAAQETVRDERLWIIHGHGFYVYPNYVFGRLARKFDLPLVYHVHGFFEPWILARSKLKKRLAHWLFEDANFRAVALWRALTVKEAEQIRNIVGSTASIVVAPNGVELAPFEAIPRPNVREKHVALFVGRLHPKKGLDLLFDAWGRLGAVRKDWELIIAGPDEGGYEAVAKRMASELDGGVRFIGVVTGSAKYELLIQADLFILTSYSEGLPMAVIEAMAARVPVVVTNECNLPEVAEAEAGWLCRAERDDVRRALLEALSAGDIERRQRGEKGRKLVESTFTWKKTVAILRESCEKLL